MLNILSFSSLPSAETGQLAAAIQTANDTTTSLQSIGTWWMWLAFFTIVLVVLAIDLIFVGGGKQHRVSLKEAGSWSLVWVSLALSFGAGLWFYLDAHYTREFANTKTMEYLTGYLIEKSLAVDNVFVWLMLFNFFAIPLELQKRVLTYGVLGAIILRTIMIFAGVWLIAHFHWLLYVFGAFLLLTGIKMWWMADKQIDLNNNPLLNWFKRHFAISDHLEGERFFVVVNGVKLMTPLFLALIMVEISDIIFAVDSIPAIFAITSDPFIVLTSNIFAILGLRAMYFLLADIADRFAYIKYGLALVLIFIGVKMLLIDIYKIPIGVSLTTVALLIGGSVLISWIKTKPAASGIE
ncbi:TerC family protein [Cellvibrio sp. QJXJ]|jgi:tellurite resistance protein TerC|uniref:TerC family protein n=1 Tax=Cellvibrio sp. QJXJ TaxID=2964606 RepID=UPI0021C2C824|nr:TerC family protein [Cellvibrio sp. QJXJ]UUA72972.1 TerC family protein [Cellvibrio sp. QJXJ]